MLLHEYSIRSHNTLCEKKTVVELKTLTNTTPQTTKRNKPKALTNSKISLAVLY
jgi:hypothetical protein